MVTSVRARSVAFHLSLLLSDHLPLQVEIPHGGFGEWGHPATHPTATAPAAAPRGGLLYNAALISGSAEVLPLLGTH